MEPNNAPEQGQNKYTKLAGNTMIFAISSFSSKLLTLIVQPFLTYAMRDVQSMGVSKLDGDVQRHHPLWPGQGQQ